VSVGRVAQVAIKRGIPLETITAGFEKFDKSTKRAAKEASS
jgi:hypothetical protein